jgi:hypothetical protein
MGVDFNKKNQFLYITLSLDVSGSRSEVSFPRWEICRSVFRSSLRFFSRFSLLLLRFSFSIFVCRSWLPAQDLIPAPGTLCAPPECYSLFSFSLACSSFPACEQECAVNVFPWSGVSCAWITRRSFSAGSDPFCVDLLKRAWFSAFCFSAGAPAVFQSSLSSCRCPPVSLSVSVLCSGFSRLVWPCAPPSRLGSHFIPRLSAARSPVCWALKDLLFLLCVCQFVQQKRITSCGSYIWLTRDSFFRTSFLPSSS